MQEHITTEWMNYSSCAVITQLSSFHIVILQACCIFDFAGLVLRLGCILATVVDSYLWYVPYIGLGSGTQVPHVMRHRSGTL